MCKNSWFDSHPRGCMHCAKHNLLPDMFARDDVCTNVMVDVRVVIRDFNISPMSCTEQLMSSIIVRHMHTRL